MYKTPHRIALAAFVGLGIALRISTFDRALWIDEAWVVNSAQSASWREMFFYSAWIQTTPPGLLSILRLLLTVFDCGIETLRWVPITASVMTLLLFARLASRLFKPPAAVLACAVLAFSPEVIWYGTEVKQFSFDMLAMLIYLTLGRAYIQQPSRQRLWQWGAGYVLSLAFSYTAMFSLPAIAMIAWMQGRGTRAGRRELLPVVATLALITASIYLYFVRPNAGYPNLRQFWIAAFPLTAHQPLQYFFRTVLNRLFLFTQVDVLAPLRAFIAIAVLVAGALLCARPAHHRPMAGACLALLVIVPLVTTGVANFLGLYPVGDIRLVVFLVPCVLILLVAVFAEMVTRWSMLAPVQAQQGCEFWSGLVAAMAVTYMLCLSAGLPNWAARSERAVVLWQGTMDVRPVMSFLHAVDSLHRPVYVQAYFSQLFKLYTRAHPLAAPVSFAQSGWPCCIPNQPWRGYGINRDDIALEVDRLVEQFRGQSIYLLLARYPKHLSNDAAHVYAELLAAKQCPVTWRWSDRRIEFIKAQCKAKSEDTRVSLSR